MKKLVLGLFLVLGIISFGLGTGNMDSGTDSVASARVDLYDNFTALGFGTTTTGITITGEASKTVKTTTNGSVAVAQGIIFPATQSASSGVNTLDDYEEGTWTPVIKIGTTDITGTITTATYTKIGRIVYIRLILEFNRLTNTGTIGITGLTFPLPNSIPISSFWSFGVDGYDNLLMSSNGDLYLNGRSGLVAVSHNNVPASTVCTIVASTFYFVN